MVLRKSVEDRLVEDNAARQLLEPHVYASMSPGPVLILLLCLLNRRTYVAVRNVLLCYLDMYLNS